MAHKQETDTVPALKICRRAQADDSYEVSRIDGAWATKAYVCVRPDAGGTFETQVAQVYERLDALLRDQGARRQDVITEKVFFHDLEQEFDALDQARIRFYASTPLGGPATTYLQQPPCREGILIELQARVIFASSPDHNVEVDVLDADLGAGSARILRSHGYEHIFAHNITGGTPGDGLDYAAQTTQVFDKAEVLLESLGLTFKDVVRTWLYLPEMERDYDDLNRVRSAFFDRVGVERLPASTGIQGGVYPICRGGSMDLYTLRGPGIAEKRLMHAPTLNEAPVYGSRFSRGMEVTREDRRVLYVSGTASIDDHGQVVAVGDIEGQIQRMLTNVAGLLAGSRATPKDVVRATTYLKDPEDYEILQRIWRQRGFPGQIPHTICRADVCRPDWLCETEVAAILPRSRDDA